MMKRTLIVLLVLGLTSVANAALSWSLSEVIVDVDVGPEVITINSDNALPYSEAWINDEAGAVIQSIVAMPSAGDGAVVKDPDASGYPGWWTVEGADFNPDDGALESGAQYDVTLMGTQDQISNTYSVFLDTYGANEELAVTIIPEPMTLMLLGLGGLFLRRRK
jgi:hypothetical protein